MKIIKGTIAFFFALMLIFFSAHFTSCTKTVHDTTVRTVVDTVKYPVHDTTVKVEKDTIYDLNDGLVAFYNFNGGNLHDSSGYNNNITFNSATPAADRFGRANNAYLFDGISSYMQVPNSPSLNPGGTISMMSIFKINGFYTGLCHGNDIISKGTPDNISGFYALRFADYINQADCSLPPNLSGETVTGIFYPNGVYPDTVTLKTGQWYNVVYTYDGVKSRIYINGDLKKEFNSTGSTGSNSNDLFIGKHESSQYPYNFNGVIDEIRIYNEALTPEEVKQLNKLTE